LSVSELEIKFLDLLFITRNESQAASNAHRQQSDQSANDSLESNIQLNEPSYLRSLTSFIQYGILSVSLASFIYYIIKLGLILKQTVDNENRLPMGSFYFISFVVSVLFALIELVLACLSWFFMNTLSRTPFSEITDSSVLADKTKKKVNLKRLFSLSKPELHLLSLGFIALCLSSATQVVAPYYFGQVIDAAEKYADLSKMNMAVLTMFVMYVAGSVASGFRSWLFQKAGARVVARLRKDVFSAILRQDIKFFDSNRTGELTSRISSDTQVIQNAGSKTFSFSCVVIANLI
jgi:hypothetical protein